MHLMIEEVMRGGISYIAKRFSNANNKYIKSNNNSKPSINKYIYIYIYISFIWMQIIYMVGQWTSISLLVDFNG